MPVKNANFTLRISKAKYERYAALVAKLGMSVNTGLDLFVRQIAMRKTIPDVVLLHCMESVEFGDERIETCVKFEREVKRSAAEVAACYGLKFTKLLELYIDLSLNCRGIPIPIVLPEEVH